ncbi:PPOX class F420-dependent oxidoreductase [Gordonia jinhuaensis]|uniref:Pyridoxamine 5'-phosphate oxidase n=1 Tax=Gordonia jinhuaensis TaxID=1517702 RepID=A0A916T642_9ACTN|nr:PPOX class F420-dependent oxidoreductase [Gordonia jinhuaensis]GGB33404.1 putative pyridoxamine 5'-phosphate oxidase [Gordonia jinhuaensis]
MSNLHLADSHRDLMEAPLFGMLGTIRYDGSVQVNPMWFVFDESAQVSFTTSTTRVKYLNLHADPRFSLCIADPTAPYRYLEIRGRITEVDSDHNGDFFSAMAQRYGRKLGGQLPPDVMQRVRLKGTVERWSGQ